MSTCGYNPSFICPVTLENSEMATKPGERKLQILQTIAEMLENPASEKVTTAALAAKLDV